MMRGDVSFTFLDRVREIELNIKDRRWQSALALALTLPDICGGIAYPEHVKRYRDGRIMTDRYGNPTRDIGAQYILWFDTYASAFFMKTEDSDKPYINGERCWQLRCEYLHQNKGFVNSEDDCEIHFHLGINCGSSICQFDSETKDGCSENIRLDIQQMCIRLCLAARNYYDTHHLEKDFSLYNTPVIDFIKWQHEKEDNRKNILILTDNKLYGKGISMAVESSSVQTFVCTSVSDVIRRTRKKRIDLWIIEKRFMDYDGGKWFTWQTDAVIILTKISDHPVPPNPAWKYFSIPFSIEALTDYAESCL